MSHVSDFDHRRLDATVYPDCVVEVHRISDTTRGLRKVAVTKIWRTERVLGRGTFGEVHLQLEDRDPESKRAVKVIRTGGRMESVECERELTALIEFTKPKYKEEAVFVQFFGWFQTENAIYLAMEYIPLGDLENNLQELEQSRNTKRFNDVHTGGVLSEKEVKDIANQILEGVKIMHAEGFAHRDLKPQNVLVVQREPQWWVKLGDFGLSKKRTEATILQTQAGTQSYMAPEMFCYVSALSPESSEYTHAVDIWAVGCITYRILTRKAPFPELYSLKKYCKNPKLPVFLAGAENFVWGLLTPHPRERLTASAALEHPWLSTSEHEATINVSQISQRSANPVVDNTPKAISNDTRPLFDISNNSQSQYYYNTASHAAFRSYHKPDMEKSKPSVNNQWPKANLPQAKKLMLETSTTKRFDSLSLSTDTTIAVEEQQRLVKEKQTVEQRQKLMLKGNQNPKEEISQKLDSKVAASASQDQTVRLWDAATGPAWQTLKGHSGGVNSVAFSPDGKLVASASQDHTVMLWDPMTGAARQMFQGHSNWVNSVVFSPDGKLMASASQDHTVRLWDTATGTVQQTLKGHSDWVMSVAFSPDGKLVASASGDHTVRLWDVAMGAVQQTLKGHSGWVLSVAVSPDGKLIASASQDHTVRLWDTATGAVRQTLKGHSDWVMSVAFSPDGKLMASSSRDHTVRLWDAAMGAVRQTLKGHSDWVSSVAFSPDGKLVASSSEDHTVRLWDAATGAARQMLKGHLDWVRSVTFSPDGKLVASSSQDHTVRLWDLTTKVVEPK